MYTIFDFSTFSKLGKLIYVQKSRSEFFFADPCKNRKRKFNYVRFFLYCAVTKPYKIKSQFFCSKVPMSKFFKT